MTPRYFGEYILGEYLGGGLYTKVYKAHSSRPAPRYGNPVAIKILRWQGNFWEQRRLIKQFEREAAIAMQLHHPNLVRVYNVGRFFRHYAIIMEYVPGQNLKQYLYEKEKLPLQTLLNICYQAGQGLAHIHDNFIVHKDVKPDNILVSRDFKIVKMTDFGIAKLPHRLLSKDIFPKGGTVTKYGTISYVAPEQQAGNAEFRSDIYSFGVTIDEVITAKLEVPDKNHEDYFARIDLRSQRKNQGRQPIMAADLPIPEGLAQLIRKATHPEPVLRYQTMHELLHELQAFI
ncbi:MAG TPA: serine/threonine-protein kinase [bacterium]|nr:serine/threonine-protein kinase [bacterium]HOL67956.1 serine/threonine-protein kinase [bacterium]